MLRKPATAWKVLLLSSLLSISALVGCQSAAPKLVGPPLPAPPELKSMVPDKNDKTGEVGLWMNMNDGQKEAVYRETVESVRRNWR